MPDMIHPFMTLETDTLSVLQVSMLQQLAAACCQHDQIRLSYPVSESTGSDDTGIRHWLCLHHDGTLCAALALLFYEDSLAECIAFTHPDYRRQGLFSDLLNQALSYCELSNPDCDILFTTSGQCPDTLATLRALGAERVSEECQMELELSGAPALPLSQNAASCVLLESQDADTGDALWEMTGCPRNLTVPVLLGSCRTVALSDTCICLHQVEILPEFRGQGYGHALMQLLLPTLYSRGIRHILLEVSGDNAAALNLYKKTGFRITETLSCYLY